MRVGPELAEVGVEEIVDASEVLASDDGVQGFALLGAGGIVDA